MPGSESIASLRKVTKIFGTKSTQVKALDELSLDIFANQLTVIMGPSGSGKSTLLYSIAGLDTVNSGAIWVAGQQISTLNDDKLTRFRRENIGFVFQAFNLLPMLDARANIELPMRLSGKKINKEWFNVIVERLGLADRLTHKPFQLSGGQQQRVAIARALLARPALLVADEPTGNLDSASSAEVLLLLNQAVKDFGQTVVMVTHDQHAAHIGDRVLVLRDGKLVHDLVRPTVEQIAQVA